MGLLGDLTPEDCNSDKLLFNKDEVVEFVGIDHRTDANKGHIFIKAKVLSGEHEGKDHTIFLAGGDSEMSRKQKAMFFYKSGFWTEDELKNDDVSLARLINRKFQAKASKVTEKNGEKYQNMLGITDMGELDAPQEASDPANKTDF